MDYIPYLHILLTYLGLSATTLSLSTRQLLTPPLPPPPYTYSGCAAAAEIWQTLISQNLLPAGSMRSCQWDIPKGNWKWKTQEGCSSLFSSCCHPASAEGSCLQLLALLHLAAALPHLLEILATDGSRALPPRSKSRYAGASPTKFRVSSKGPPLWAPSFRWLCHFFLFFQHLGCSLISPVTNFWITSAASSYSFSLPTLTISSLY